MRTKKKKHHFFNGRWTWTALTKKLGSTHVDICHTQCFQPTCSLSSSNSSMVLPPGSSLLSSEKKTEEKKIQQNKSSMQTGHIGFGVF